MNNPLTRLKFVIAAFICALLLIILLADQGALPAFISRLYAFPHGDKVGHFLLMGVLSFLINLNLVWKKNAVNWRKLLLASLAISVLITIEEFSQVLFRSRSFSLSDLFFSLLGIWLFGCLAAGFAKNFGTKNIFKT